MATRLQTDPATIVRIVRGLALAATASSSVICTSSRSPTLPPGHHAIRRPRWEQAVARTRLSRAGLEKLAGPQKQSRRTAPRRVGKTLLRGPSDRLLAGDLAVHSRTTSNIRPVFLGLPVFAATSAGRIVHLVRSVNKQDLVIAIQLPRGLRQNHRGAQQATRSAALIASVSLTPMFLPWRVNVTKVFLASIESTSFGASYAAPIALLNAILAAVGQYRRAQTLALAKETRRRTAQRIPLVHVLTFPHSFR